MKNFEDQPATGLIASAPDWAPDNTPPAVVKLIADEQYVEDLGLRGLASADSAEYHQAVRKLQAQLGEAFAKGTRSRGWRRRGTWVLLAVGALAGAGAAGLAVLVGMALRTAF